MAHDKLEVLQSLSFGQRVAEEEIAELSRYFVQTDQWRKLFAGEADIVYGLKGSGKSALYSTLLAHRQELQEKGILLIAGENPRGTPAFQALVSDPPTSEVEFRNLWKIYLLQLIAGRFRADAFDAPEALELVRRLEESSLLPKSGGLRGLVRTALDYVRHFTKPEGVEGTLKLDPLTALPTGVSGKITFAQPNSAAEKAGAVDVDFLFGLANAALAGQDLQIWILLDRLDVAFAEGLELEQNALRALFIVYADLRSYDRITPKVFSPIRHLGANHRKRLQRSKSHNQDNHHRLG